MSVAFIVTMGCSSSSLSSSEVNLDNFALLPLFGPRFLLGGSSSDSDSDSLDFLRLLFDGLSDSFSSSELSSSSDSPRERSPGDAPPPPPQKIVRNSSKRLKMNQKNQKTKNLLTPN